MSPQIKYAHKTHNTWVYRRTYPKALQPLLGSALKQSLKTGDAREAKLRVAELNQTFTTIIKEAQAHALATPHTAPATAAQGPRLAVGRPRYQRARLVGERLVAELAQAYLAEVSQRLRPGSYKSVRFALGLLGSHLGKYAVGDLSLSHGKEVLGVHHPALSQRAQVQGGQGRWLARACNALTGARGFQAGTPDPGAYPQADVPVP